ncbi:MAG: divalent cation tolerance protein CutA, partial [Nitrosotalea sp.]
MGIVIVSTYPDKKSISRIAHIVVEKKLAACVNYT